MTSRRSPRKAPRRAAAPSPPALPARTAADADPAPAVGANLRRLRAAHGLSLERLAQVSGVSRAMLGQIELGQSTPTVGVLWKVARAFHVPFSALLAAPEEGRAVVMKAADAKVLSSADGSFTSRALFPFDQPRRAEFYELRIAAGAVENAEAHAPGTVENLVVNSGSVQIRIGDHEYRLSAGDALQFDADLPHEYRNSGTTAALLYLVMTYDKNVA